MNGHLKIIVRIFFAAAILFGLNYFAVDSAVFYLLPYLIAGYDVIIEAVRGIREGEIFGECFLMSIATIGALILGEYNEACAVMIFYQTGEFFADYASEKTRGNITALMDLRPDYANIEKPDGTTERVPPSSISEGSIILVRPGEKIPIDGVIVDGHSGIDTSALTGESMPREVMPGSEVLSGSVNLSGVIKLKTTRTFTQSTASKIIELIESAGESKSSSEKFITRFAKIYTPSVCISAILIALIPTLLSGNFRVWFYRALTFLVVSCPCALVVSVPLAFFAAVGAAGRRGILIKGGIFIERLAEVSTMIFDKTGTLTRGIFGVTGVYPVSMSPDELLHFSAHAERFSHHPAADALRRAYPKESDSCIISDAQETAGLGVSAVVNGHTVCAGKAAMIGDVPKVSENGTVIHVSVDGKYSGHVVINDTLKKNAESAIKALKSEGVKNIMMLTGDNEQSAREAAISAGIDDYRFGLLPSDKVEIVSSLKGVKAFAGDGINDAPVLACADVGIAMGALGSDAAVEAADVVIMDDDLMKIPEAVKISRRCMKIVRQNVYGSIGVKMLCLLLGALGFAGMRLAVFADVGVLMLAVINSIRAMRP